MFRKILLYLTLAGLCSVMIGIPVAHANLGGAFSAASTILSSSLTATQYIATGATNTVPGFTFSDNTAIGVYHPNSNRVAVGKSTNAFIDIDTNSSAVTTVGSWTFAGATTDITTNPNEDFTIAPNGTGQVIVSGGTKMTINGIVLHTVAPSSVTTGTCTAESLATGGDEAHGIITATCTAQTWIIVFTTTYGRAPVCVVTPINAASSADAGTVYVTTTTSLTATITTATTSGQWAYQCME